jgi:hypothetical protein
MYEYMSWVIVLILMLMLTYLGNKVKDHKNKASRWRNKYYEEKKLREKFQNNLQFYMDLIKVAKDKGALIKIERKGNG